jgi:hypothetical protein
VFDALKFGTADFVGGLVDSCLNVKEDRRAQVQYEDYESFEGPTM